MQSFTVSVMIGVRTDISLLYICFYMCTFLIFFFSFRFYLCTVCTIFIIITMSAGTERFSRDAEINDCRVDVMTKFYDSVFQMEEATAGKARLPTEESLTDFLQPLRGPKHGTGTFFFIYSDFASFWYGYKLFVSSLTQSRQVFFLRPSSTLIHQSPSSCTAFHLSLCFNGYFPGESGLAVVY